MVRKLMKHELYALFRIVLWISLAVVLFAIISRLLLSETIVQAATDSGLTNQMLIVTIFIVVFYVLSICALVIAAWAVSIYRFTKSLFSGEGYMTLSLPATASQLIWSKLLSALIVMAYAAVVSLGSLVILFSGVVGEAMDIGMLFETFGILFEDLTGGGILYLVELGISAVVSIPLSLLVIYAGISLGQLFTSHRVGMVLLIFAALYVGGNIFSVLVELPLQNFLYTHVAGAQHILIWLRIVCSAAVEVGCFFLVRYILRNKVNLIA